MLKASYRSRMKKLLVNLRFAQMHVRQDLSGLARSKEEVRRTARQMRQLQEQYKKEL